MCANASCCCCELLEELRSARQDDAVWILSSSFIIFTMQSGFGLLESGCVSALSNVNVMAKNVIDVICGGLAYWSIGFGLSFGSSSWSNAFIGFGDFFYDPDSWDHEDADTGWGYARFMLQLSFATTAATIVSGAMAERTRLRSYIIFSTLLVLVEALPAHWVWSPEGFLYQLQVIDIAGGSVVHLVGGTAGLVATLMLKPRHDRWASGKREMSSPTNALLGTFILWWGWLGFNCGSTWGVTRGRWKLAARAAVATIQSSIGGGVTALIASFVAEKKCKIDYLIDGILSGLVSITSLCALARPWHSLIIGSVGSLLAIGCVPLLERLKIDDPVGVVPVHLVSSLWGMLSVGIFAESDRISNLNKNNTGFVHGHGSGYLIAVQSLACVIIIAWTATCSVAILTLLKISPVGLRLSREEEKLGSDAVEHDLMAQHLAGYRVRNHWAKISDAVSNMQLENAAPGAQEVKGSPRPVAPKNNQNGHVIKEDEEIEEIKMD